MATTRKKLPVAEQEQKELPEIEVASKPLPEPTMKAKELPPVGSPENTVIIGGKPIEIKPTKVKYQRNRTAAFYRIIRMYPLVDILAMEAGSFGDDRDGDKAIMDWLIAVFDDEQLVLENYEEMDTALIEKILLIFLRINKIDEKEEHLKNLEKERMMQE